jgi:hypothetical protein
MTTYEISYFPLKYNEVTDNYDKISRTLVLGKIESDTDDPEELEFMMAKKLGKGFDCSILTIKPL